MPTNDFKAVATSDGALVLTQENFAALTAIIANGLTNGIVPAELFNKLFRQSSTISATVAQYMADMSGDDVLDNGDAAALLATLKKAVAAQITSASRAVILDDAAFAPGVTNGEVVRWDAANNRYVEAINDGTANNRAVGIADVSNGKVYAMGESLPVYAGLVPGSRYYLSATTAGAISATRTPNAICIGIAKSATTVFIDIDTGEGGGATGGGADAVFYLNDKVVTADFTVPTGQNAMSAGPITINDGVTVTVTDDDSEWSVI